MGYFIVPSIALIGPHLYYGDMFYFIPISTVLSYQSLHPLLFTSFLYMASVYSELTPLKASQGLFSTPSFCTHHMIDFLPHLQFIFLKEKGLRRTAHPCLGGVFTSLALASLTSIVLRRGRGGWIMPVAPAGGT